MITQEERVDGAKAIKIALQFKSEMILSAPDADGFQVITLPTPKMGTFQIGAFKAGEVYKGMVVSTGTFQGAGIFEGLSYGGDWDAIRENLIALVNDWIVPTLAPPAA
jgi:hypothetical protein